jgi:hypothetical protein
MLLLGRWSKVRRFSRLLYLGSKNTLPPSVSTLAENKAGVAHPKVTVCFKSLRPCCLATPMTILVADFLFLPHETDIQVFI